MRVVMWSIRVFVGWLSALIIVGLFGMVFEELLLFFDPKFVEYKGFFAITFGVSAGLYIGLKKSWWVWLERLLLSMPTTVKSSIKSTVVGTAKVVDEIQDSVAESRQNRREDENQNYALAMQEVENGNPDPGLWARAYAESDGDETKQKVIYLKLRVEQLGPPS